MRLLYLHHGYAPHVAGAERMAYRTAAACIRNGHEVAFARAVPPQLPEDAPGLALITARAPDAIAEAASRSLGGVPDAVHLFDLVDATYAAVALRVAAALARPLVVTAATAAELWRDPEIGLGTILAADAAVALTDRERATWMGWGLPADRIHLVPQGANLQPGGDAARFRRLLPPGGPIVLFVGRKTAFKGYRLLLEAASTVWRRVPDARFVLIGPRVDEDCSEVFARLGDPRIVEFGLVDDGTKADAISAADVVCVPSTLDVLPLVLLEAWAARRPVAACAFPGSAAVLRDGVNAAVAEPTPPHLGAAIVRILENATLAEHLGRSGSHQRVGAGWAAVADRLTDIYGAVRADPSQNRGGHDARDHHGRW